MKNCKMLGKIWEKSGNFEVNNYKFSFVFLVRTQLFYVSANKILFAILDHESFPEKKPVVF